MTRGGAYGPLSGRSIVLTRSADDSRVLAEWLTDAGAEVHLIPLNEIRPAPDAGAGLIAALADLDSYDWVVLTSANGVRALVELRGAVPWPDSVHVAVVGEATAEVADAAGLPVTFIPSEATAARLVAEFPTALPGSARVLAPLAELASSTVYDGLTAKGYEVDQVVAYRSAAPTIDPVLEPSRRSWVATADVVVLAAPSAASRFSDRFSDMAEFRGVPVVCIGPATAKRATGLGLSVSAVANPHNDDGLYDVIRWLLTDTAG